MVDSSSSGGGVHLQEENVASSDFSLDCRDDSGKDDNAMCDELKLAEYQK